MGWYYATKEIGKLKCAHCKKEIGEGKPHYFLDASKDIVAHFRCVVKVTEKSMEGGGKDGSSRKP